MTSVPRTSPVTSRRADPRKPSAWLRDAIGVVRVLLRMPFLFLRSWTATRHAARVGAPGVEFASFGRMLGLRALRVGERTALDLLLTPVSIVRYWEFPFVLRHLEPSPGRCLDISSPRLISFYIASRLRPTNIRMLNPDRRDAGTTRRLAARLGIPGIVVEAQPVSTIEGLEGEYDSIWSVSVVEHIPDDGDVEAMRLMYAALAPGGTAIVTVPVDRQAWDEFRQEDVYRLGVALAPQGLFFQRWYDESAIVARLLEPVKRGDVHLEWFGERVPGRFAAYEQDWRKHGRDRTVSDPREIADWYTTYARWSDMPGMGVCGIVVRKPG